MLIYVGVMPGNKHMSCISTRVLSSTLTAHGQLFTTPCSPLVLALALGRTVHGSIQVSRKAFRVRFFALHTIWGVGRTDPAPIWCTFIQHTGAAISINLEFYTKSHTHVRPTIIVRQTSPQRSAHLRRGRGPPPGSHQPAQSRGGRSRASERRRSRAAARSGWGHTDRHAREARAPTAATSAATVGPRTRRTPPMLVHRATHRDRAPGQYMWW